MMDFEHIQCVLHGARVQRKLGAHRAVRIQDRAAIECTIRRVQAQHVQIHFNATGRTAADKTERNARILQRLHGGQCVVRDLLFRRQQGAIHV